LPSRNDECGRGNLGVFGTEFSEEVVKGVQWLVATNKRYIDAHYERQWRILLILAVYPATLTASTDSSKASKKDRVTIVLTKKDFEIAGNKRSSGILRATMADSIDSSNIYS
jgi:hypothetical protein